jgi:hypothetical protein
MFSIPAMFTDCNAYPFYRVFMRVWGLCQRLRGALSAYSRVSQQTPRQRSDSEYE